MPTPELVNCYKQAHWRWTQYLWVLLGFVFVLLCIWPYKPLSELLISKTQSLFMCLTFSQVLIWSRYILDFQIYAFCCIKMPLFFSSEASVPFKSMVQELTRIYENLTVTQLLCLPQAFRELYFISDKSIFHYGCISITGWIYVGWLSHLKHFTADFCSRKSCNIITTEREPNRRKLMEWDLSKVFYFSDRGILNGLALQR